MEKNESKVRNYSLKYKIILGSITAVIVPFFIAGVIIYLFLSDSLIEMSTNRLVTQADDTASLIHATLMKEIKLMSAIAADPDVITALKTGKYQTAQLELEMIHQRIGEDLFTIFLADKNGIAQADAFFKQQIGLDLSDRDYFQDAKKGNIAMSGPIPARGTATPGSPILILSVPIEENGEFLGIIAIPFNIDFIIDILEQRKVGKTGYAFILDSEGLVLVHPKKEFILSLNLHDLSGMDQLKALLKSNKRGTAFYTFEGNDKIAAITNIPLTDWSIAFTQDKSEIMSPVNRILLVMFVSLVVSLLITISLLVISSSRISSPVQKMIEMMKQITYHSRETIVQIGLDRKIIYANPAYEKVCGLSSDAITKSELELANLKNIPPEAIWASLEKGISWSGKVTLHNTEAQSATLEVMLVPLINNGEEIQGYLEIGRDITNEIIFEKKLRQSQKIEAIGTLAGGIAHDFNNILSGIFGYTELLLIEKELGANSEKYLKEIMSASERARDLVSQILTFSRQTEVEFRPILPKTILKEVLKLLRASIPASIEIQSKLESNSVIIAEPTQIYQVVMNLFMNAIHAIGDNNGVIKLKLEDFMVDEKFTSTHPEIKTGKHIVIRISDTGKGIDPKILEQIFEPFFTTKPQGKGTGLGLSVVHGIVKKMNGIITTYSEVGKGTVFNIFIPVSNTDTGNISESEQLVHKGTERIAIIDDEMTILTTTKSILTNLGYSITAFHNSMEALETIKADPDDFDLIITDYSMPLLTGVELSKRLKEAGIQVPVILTSGFHGQLTEDSAHNAGIAMMIRKPLNAYQLTNAIHKILHKEKS